MQSSITSVPSFTRRENIYKWSAFSATILSVGVMVSPFSSLKTYRELFEEGNPTARPIIANYDAMTAMLNSLKQNKASLESFAEKSFLYETPALYVTLDNAFSSEKLSSLDDAIALVEKDVHTAQNVPLYTAYQDFKKKQSNKDLLMITSGTLGALISMYISFCLIDRRAASHQ